MKGYLRARNSGLGDGIGLALANGDYRDAVLLGDYLGDCLEDCLNFNVLVGHDKLVVRYLYAALYDLPLLEAEALLGSSGEGYLGVFNGCLCGCGCSAVFIGRHSDAVRDGVNRRLFTIGEYRLNFYRRIGHNKRVAFNCNVALDDLIADKMAAFVGQGE